MNRNTWKAGERRVAAFFGARGRTPLSGGNSGHTRSDTLHERLYIEVKHRKKHALRTLHDEAKALSTKEDKVPVLAHLDLNRPGFLVTVHSDDLDKFIQIYQEGRDGADQQGNQGEMEEQERG